MTPASEATRGGKSWGRESEEPGAAFPVAMVTSFARTRDGSGRCPPECVQADAPRTGGLLEIGLDDTFPGVDLLQTLHVLGIIPAAAIAAVREGVVAQEELSAPALSAVGRRPMRGQTVHQSDVSRLEFQGNCLCL